MNIVKSTTYQNITLEIRITDVPVLEPLMGYAIFPRDVEITWEHWSDNENTAWEATVQVRGARRLVSGKPGAEHHGIKFYVPSSGLLWAPYVKDVPAWLTELIDQTRPVQTKEA